MLSILMMPPKLTTLELLIINTFWKNDYTIIISVHDATNKILSREPYYIVDVVMQPKFGNCSISKREVIMIWYL